MGTRAGAVGISFLLKKVKEQLIYQLIHQLIEQYKMYQLEGEENMITKTQFKDVCKKAAIYTIMSHPERISDNCINDEEVAAILVRFYEKIFRKVYSGKEEPKECIDINEIDEIYEIYVIAFDCLYKDDGITPNYVIYQENMLCLTSINALYEILRSKIEDDYCELERDIDGLLNMWND